MYGLTPLGGYFIDGQIEHPQLVIFEHELFNGINSLACELIFPKTEFFNPPVNLQHFSKVYR